MAKPNFGRFARLYIDSTLITRQKDMDHTDEAADMKAEARDLPYAVHAQGGKDLILTFEILDDNGTSFQLLQTKYDNGADVNVMLVKNTSGATSPKLEFVGVVLKFEPKYGMNDAVVYAVTIAPSDPDNPPTRGTWTAP